LAGRSTERGLTLLEVVIALMLFAMMSTLLLVGQGQAADSILRAKIERQMAELVSFRINMVALHLDDYEDGDTGEFPASGASSRLVDEEELFTDERLYGGYTWLVEIEEAIGAGAGQAVRIEDSEPKGLLFSEEGGAAPEGEEEEEPNVEPDEVDRMLFIRVTVFPPGYEEAADPEDEDTILRPRSAWTAVYLPPEKEE
jgi:prepilin-type N-terminal cleavage/methylation domain-containing protein